MTAPCPAEQCSAQQEKRAERWRFLAVVVVSMAIFLDSLDVSIVNVALPNIQRDLALSTIDLPWVQGAYLLTYAGLMLLGGRAADLLGRRRIFLLGAALFGLASLASGLATSGWLLILARGGEGIGAALTAPSAVSILTTTFAEGPERNKALGVFSATGGVGFTFGLVFGGVLTNFISWHWVFLVNVPVVVLILGLSLLVVPEGRSMGGMRSYDSAGVVTVTGGLLLLVYAITQANAGDATLEKTTGLATLAFFLLVCFIIIEWRSKAPLMPLSIFRSHTLSASSVVLFTLLGSFFSFLLIYTLYLQEVLRSSPLLTSLLLLPGSVLTIPISQFVAPWLMNRLGVRLSSVLGMVCLFSGIALFLGSGASANYVGIILPSTILCQISMGICIPTLSIAAVIGIAQTEQGLAAGLQGTVGQAGGGIMLAITGAVVAVNTAAVHSKASTSAPSAVAQLSGLHTGLLVLAGGAALGALIALVGIQQQAATDSRSGRQL